MSAWGAANGAAAGVLARCLVGGGVGHVVVSPGARSAPLALAFAGTGARVHVVLDERVAGFVALGLARVAGPVALVGTSGSAGAHWLPAAIEARQSRLPLVLLTADRPPELHGCGAPQTVPQGRLFGDACVWAADLGAPAPGVDPRWLRTVAARALDEATRPGGGPVHLNAPFREPLWEPGAVSEGVAPARILRPRPVVPPGLVAEVAARLTGRGVIYAGARAARLGDAGRLGAAVARLAEALGWPVLAEPPSLLRFGGPALPPVAAQMAGVPVPDVVLRLGQAPTLKRVGAFLARAPETILVDPDGDWLDPHHGATLLVAADPAPLCEALAERVTHCGAEWGEAWREAGEGARRHAAAACDGFWEGTVARTVAAALPDGALLHVASSLPVRDLDAFADTAADVAVTSNRGANGIDGTVATALGQALAWGGPVVALVGDLAFLHDHAALHAARALGARLVVVVVDNGGGRIFETLPLARLFDRPGGESVERPASSGPSGEGRPHACPRHVEDDSRSRGPKALADPRSHPWGGETGGLEVAGFERLFLTPQPGDLGALAAGAGARVQRVEDAQALAGAVRGGLEREGVTVVHAVVDHELGRARRALDAGDGR